MAQFKSFPQPISLDGGDGPTPSSNSAGPLSFISGFKAGGDSSTYLDVSGYPVTDGATIKGINLNSFASLINAIQGRNSADATVWTVDLASLSTLTGASITRVYPPAYGGGAVLHGVCTDNALATYYVFTVNLETGTEALLGNYAPTTPAAGTGPFSYSSCLVSKWNDNLMIVESTAASSTKVYLINVAGAPVILQQWDFNIYSAAASPVAIYEKYAIINGTGSTGNLAIINGETGVFSKINIENPEILQLFPIEKNGTQWGEEYLNTLASSIKKVSRWPKASVSSFFDTLASFTGVKGGNL